jgi:hypothetical protein
MLVGFIDAEACFMIKLRKNVTYKTGVQVQALFSINLNQADLALLLKIQSFFGGVGIIYMDKVNNSYVYAVNSILPPGPLGPGGRPPFG